MLKSKEPVVNFVSLNLSDRDKAALVHLATASGRNMSETIRVLIRDASAQRGEEATP